MNLGVRDGGPSAPPSGLVWKLKSPSGLKGIGEKISSFPPQSPPISNEI
jgi:hypothetical protein